ncbi:MAG: acyl carrier protein [Pseudomonadota bacterium]
MNERLSDTREQIIQGLRQIVPASAQVSGDTHIMRDLNLDSLAVMDFMLTLEDRFDIVISLEKVAEVETLDDLVGVVDQLRARKLKS